MKNERKGMAQKLWIDDEEVAMLEVISDNVGLAKTEVMSLIVSAGLRSIKAGNNRMPLPLRFSLSQAEETFPIRAVKPARK